MRRSVAYPLVALGAVGSTLAVASPALAHGYVSAPPSRQALCASGAVANCGQIQFEPQSVEGPKGLTSCNAGISQFSVLADESRNWPAKSVGSSVTFTWVMTARHRTSNWEYFIRGKKVATVDGGNRQPDAVVTHNINLSAFPGRQTVLAVWNIGDTANAFYSCIDMNVGGGGGGAVPTAPAAPAAPDAPAPTTAAPATPAAPPGTAPATTAPTTAPTYGGTQPGATKPGTTQPGATQPGTSQPGSPAGEWRAGATYRTGDEVTYQGVRYQCRQGHTTIRSWEPSIYTLALWLPL